MASSSVWRSYPSDTDPGGLKRYQGSNALILTCSVRCRSQVGHSDVLYKHDTRLLMRAARPGPASATGQNWADI
eukprot:21606-Eustigmatos_ZCMA.PRE.1